MSNRLFLGFIVISCLLLAASSVPATPSQGTLTAQVNRLQATYQKLYSLQFDFSQVTETNGRTKNGKGTATFYRTGTAPSGNSGVMRWDYKEPTQQVILNDGKELSIYTPQDKQLIITPVTDMDSDFTYALFTGAQKLTDQFHVIAPDPLLNLSDPPKGMQAMQLIPLQPQPQVKRIQIWIDGSGIVQRLLMEDNMGTFTELTFSNIRRNKLSISDTQREQQRLMHLDLAPGTEVIRQ